MAKIYNLARVASATAGTGTLTLGSAVAPFLTFAEAGVADGDTVYYSIIDGTADSEIGIGTYTSSGTTLSRDTVLRSTGAGNTAKISCSGNQQVAIVYAGSSVRERLTGNLTLYVRTDGSDSNNGRANTAGGAFLTLQKAYDVITSDFDLGGYNITVQIADGTYTAGLTTAQPWTGGGTVIFQGNNGTPANVVISTTSANCFTVGAPIPGTLRIIDMKLQTTTSGSGIVVNSVGYVEYGNLNFGAMPTFHVQAVGTGAYARGISAYTISGGATYHWVSSSNAFLVDQSKTITITGTPAFGTAFAYSTRGGAMTVNANTFSGSATGSRYLAESNGIIFTNGGGATYLAGDAAGSTTTGGQYV
jgi:hypothetical protein